MVHQSALGRFLCALLLLMGTRSIGAQGAAASVTIAGARQVSVGSELTLVAQGSPAGGVYLWSLDSQGLAGAGMDPNPTARMRSDGNRAVIRGLRVSTAPGDIGLRVFYIVGGEVASARARLSSVAGDLIAYRPQHGTGYGPFARTRVGETDEESSALGPGIRINAVGDVDPSGEDDLIEVSASMLPMGAPYRLRRESSALELWTTRDKQPGTQLNFSANTTANQVGDQTLWVEWSSMSQGSTGLRLIPIGPGPAADRLLFSSFRSVVMALGGESQVPSNPVDPNHGTFVIARELYALGFDVHMRDEDQVAPNGSGAAYIECVTAVRERAVEEVVCFGYSHGGGSTYDLLERLDNNRASIGNFSVPFTSYVDSVENDSDSDLSMELRRPIGSDYHANHYQRGSLADFFLDGGPVTNSNPGSSGLDVETQPFGAGATHFIVDDFTQVTTFIKDNLLLRVQR